MSPRWRFLVPLLAGAAVGACGGGGGSGGGGGAGSAASCSATNQKQFVLDVARDWYLFTDLLPASVNPASFPDAQALLDHLTATARQQGKDRFFSFLTTPQADSSFFQEGQFIGFGFRTRIDGSRLFVPDVFESTPASEAGLARGAEITAIDSGSGFVATATVLAGDPNLAQAFGPATEGVQRGLRYVRTDGQQFEVRLTKRLITITPVPAAGGTAVLDLPSNPSVKVGYVNLRTFISTADAPLRSAYAQFRAQGIANLVVDLRYNGGGLVSIADLVGDLHGGARQTNDVYSNVRFNPARAAANDTVRRFAPQPESVSPARVAFITTGASASASELVVNSLKPWVEVAIVGSDTFGKPVGQSAFDLQGCSLRLRLVSFKITNSLEQGDYFDGLASTLPFACAAADDLTRAMSDPAEASVAAALHWIGNGACSQVMPAIALQAKPGAAPRMPLPRAATPAQIHLPGLY